MLIHYWTLQESEWERYRCIGGKTRVRQWARKGGKRSRSRGVVGSTLHGFKSNITLWAGFPSLIQRHKNQAKDAGRTIKNSMFFNEQIWVIITFYCKNIKTSLKLSHSMELNHLH